MSRPTRDTTAGRIYLDLRKRARTEDRGTDELLVLYVLERFLYRLPSRLIGTGWSSRAGCCGDTTTRDRDFADVWLLAGRHHLDAVSLREAIAATAAYRDVALAPVGDVLTRWPPTARTPGVATPPAAA